MIDYDDLFPFTVGRVIDPATYKKTDRWIVCLPHQCDEWEITTEFVGDLHEVAVAKMRAFIAQATIALDKLRVYEETKG